MLKFGKILGAAAILAVIVPAAVFAQTNVKVTTTKTTAEPVLITADSDAPVPTLYTQGSEVKQPKDNLVYQGVPYGRGMMGGNFAYRFDDGYGRAGRLGMMGCGGYGLRSGGSVAAHAFGVLVGIVTIALAWSFLFLACAIMYKKLKAMPKTDKKSEESK